VETGVAWWTTFAWASIWWAAAEGLWRGVRVRAGTVRFTDEMIFICRVPFFIYLCSTGIVVSI
jgi:hypothetical protein